MKTPRIAMIGFVLLAVPISTFAQTPPPQEQGSQQQPAPPPEPKPEEGWRFALAPYFWAPSLNGDLHVRGIDADFRVPFSDIWDALTFGGMLKGEARNGRWGVLSDVVYVALDKDSDLNLKNGTNVFDVNSKLYLWIVDVAGFYEVSRWQMGSPKEQGTFDVYAGGRYWNVETKFSASTPILDTSRNVNNTTDWVDAIVGGRVGLQFSEHFSFVALADIGGFDIGNSSKLTWSAEGFLGYRFNEAISAWAGWKYLFLNYEENNDNDLKLSFSGPVIGMAFRF